ncbi:molecular chaperone DnaK, partial [Streptomyces sp. NPDC005167]
PVGLTNLTGQGGFLPNGWGGEDTAEIRTATEKASTAAQRIGTALYAQTQAEAGEGGAADSSTPEGAGSTGDEDVVDAEIVDDERKGGAG